VERSLEFGLAGSTGRDEAMEAGAMETKTVVATGSEMILRDPARCGGDPTLVGTRIGVHDVVMYAGLYGGDLARVQVTVILSAPAEISVSSGGRESRHRQ
jgi:hypothetical protein